MKKKCNKCNVVKDVSEFGKDKYSKDGLNRLCKSCRNEYKSLKIASTLTAKQIAKKQRNTENIELFKVSKKRCYKCNLVKDVSSFNRDKSKKDSLCNYCKVCRKKIKKWNRLPEREKKAVRDQENKREQRLHYTRKWREKNKEKVREQAKKYQETNKEKIRTDKKKYKQQNKEKTNKHAKYRWETDNLYRLKINTRRSVRNYLKGGKSKKTTEIVGMNFKEFQDYLEVEYTEGMHLDHIIPQSWANNDEEVYTLNHYSNFQIITAQENLAKNDTYCKSENLKKVLNNHNNLTKLNKIIERNSDKIK